MTKLKILSLFSGIGAFEKALTNIGIEYDLKSTDIKHSVI